MKKILNSLLASLTLPTSVNADGTWVLVSSKQWDAPKNSPNYLACKYSQHCGSGYFIDVKSITEIRDRTYFNLSVNTIDKFGNKSDNSPFKSNGWSVSCKEGTIAGPNGNDSKPWGALTGVYLFLCE